MKINKQSILIASGIMIMGITQLISHFYKMSDTVLGVFFGIGIGILLLSVIKRKIISAN